MFEILALYIYIYIYIYGYISKFLFYVFKRRYRFGEKKTHEYTMRELLLVSYLHSQTFILYSSLILLRGRVVSLITHYENHLFYVTDVARQFCLTLTCCSQLESMISWPVSSLGGTRVMS